MNDEMCDTNRTTRVVAVLPLLCSGLPDTGNVNGEGTSLFQP